LVKECRSHAEYQEFLLTHLKKEDPSQLKLYEEVINKAYLLNLDPLRDYLTGMYASDQGRPATDPTDMLRSLVVMTECKVTGITQWARDLKRNRILAVICGFKPAEEEVLPDGKVPPHHVPGVGTFYDFLKRAWLADQAELKRRRMQLRAPLKKPRKKLKAGEKMAPKHPGVIKRLVDRALQGRTFERRPERLIQELFARGFVDQSVEKGLIPENLLVSGDGTSVRTGASSSGVKVCKCREKGIYRCDCPRRYSDPDATWGWDSHREEYFFGHTLYELNACTSQNNLPLYLRLVNASRHDSVTGVVALAEGRKLYPNLRFEGFVGDSAHDAYDYYRLLHKWEQAAFIALNERASGNFKYEPPIKVNEFGIPICPKGYPMAYYGFNKERCRIKWRCPKMAGKRKHRTEVVCEQPCSPSSYGRVVYTKPEWDLRLFTRVPRGTEAWKKVFNTRTASERSNKRKKIDYRLEDCRVRSRMQWYWRAHLIAMNQHLDAWVAKEKPDVLALIFGSEKVAA